MFHDQSSSQVVESVAHNPGIIIRPVCPGSNSHWSNHDLIAIISIPANTPAMLMTGKSSCAQAPAKTPT
jgi:hypothetical protein